MKQSQYFFKETSSGIAQITDIFDFIWPTAAGMWNLRWQVKGYLLARPDSKIEEIQNRFILGSGIQGANLQRACIEQSWEDQQEKFARFLLINLFAIYEAWLELVCDEIGKKTLVKSFQFPSELKKGKQSGFLHAFQQIHAMKSSFLTDEIYPELIKNRKYALAKIEELLKCYRLFKEIRNCIIHFGGVADAKAKSEYEKYVMISDPKDLGVKELPVISPIEIGKPMKVLLRGVVGFADIIIRIMVTLDAEIACAKGSERRFKSRWLEINSNRYVLKSDSLGRDTQVKRYIVKLGLPEPKKINKTIDFLKSHRLVS